METTLWLMRHPEPDLATREICYGRLDVLLSAEGVRQAHAMAATLQATPFDAIYASPLRRCMDTAKVLATGRDCAIEGAEWLREVDFGEWEGLRYDEIAARHPELYRQWMERPTEMQFPGGENFGQMRERVLAGIRELVARHCGETVGIVTHGGVTRILLAEALGMTAEHLFRIGQSYGAINCIRYVDGVPVVELMNGG